MKEKLQFVTDKLCILSWAASVQRANLYKKGIAYPLKEYFRKNVIGFLIDIIIPKYTDDGCSEEQHYKNIEELISYANEVGSDILGDSCYKYGVAQKLLNLTLKYYWCPGLIKEPPHCPVDRNIISKTKYKEKINWTQIITKKEYEEIINAIRELAIEKQLSIPMWELEYYNDLRAKEKIKEGK